MKRQYFTRLLLFALGAIAISSISSCSDSDDKDEPRPYAQAYEFYKTMEEGSLGKMYALRYRDFDLYNMNKIDLLMYATWSRDTLVKANGEKILLHGQSVEITKDNYYVESDGNKTSKRRIRHIELTKDKALQMALDDGTVIRYDSVAWTTTNCLVMARDNNGNTYRDRRKQWADTDDVYRWCSLWVVIN